VEDIMDIIEDPFLNAEFLGRRAYQEGKLLTDNPYKPVDRTSSLRYDLYWESGYVGAINNKYSTTYVPSRRSAELVKLIVTYSLKS
jgi:hypothetical protein